MTNANVCYCRLVDLEPLELRESCREYREMIIRDGGLVECQFSDVMKLLGYSQC